MTNQAEAFIKLLNLKPHPEGGYYKESYRSTEQIPQAGLPERFSGERNFSTCIYFLMQYGQFSAFHRIKSDEGWHFYSGVPYLLSIIHPDGRLDQVLLGQDILAGQHVQYYVPAGCWFGGQPKQTGYTLMGCTVAPGFEFNDFELANRNDLSLLYPQHAKIIHNLTRN